MIRRIRNAQVWCQFMGSLGRLPVWLLLKPVCCPVCRHVVSAELKSLHNDGWVDRHSRAVITEFTLYHPQSTLFSSVRLVLETPPLFLHRATASMLVASVYLYKYTSTVDYVVLVAEACNTRLLMKSASYTLVIDTVCIVCGARSM